MADERDQIERLLGTSWEPDAWPPVAERFLAARERAGLTQDAVAKRVGIQPSEYWDIELYDSEAFDCFSLDELGKLATVLQTPLVVLFFGPAAQSPKNRTEYSEIAHKITDLAQHRHVTIAELGDQIGWKLEQIVEDSATVGELNVVGLRDICRAIGVDWVTVLPVA